MAGILLIVIGIIIYFTPTFVAWNKKCASGVIVLNLFLGWTFFGWVAALIWAVSGK